MSRPDPDRPGRPEGYAAYAAALGDACALCDMPHGLDVEERTAWTWVFAAFPYRTHHTMLVPKRHVASFAELSPEEVAELQELVAEAERRYVARGIVGAEARYGYLLFSWRNRFGLDPRKQQVAHLHLHAYPGYAGRHDVPVDEDAADTDLTLLREAS